MAVSEISRLKMRPYLLVSVILLLYVPSSQSNKYEYLVDNSDSRASFSDYDFKLIDNVRVRRDVTLIPTTTKTVDDNTTIKKNSALMTSDLNVTYSQNITKSSTYVPPHANVGVNGSGIRKDTGLLGGVKASDPIHADDTMEYSVDEHIVKYPNVIAKTALFVFLLLGLLASRVFNDFTLVHNPYRVTFNSAMECSVDEHIVKYPNVIAKTALFVFLLLGLLASRVFNDFTLVHNPYRVTFNSGKVDKKAYETDLLETVDETDEKLKQVNNITDLQTDNHVFYNSTFYTDPKYFDEYWKNITASQVDPHPVLSNAYRRATSFHLSFEFPYYGHKLRNLTVATGGFIYTGDHVHTWLAATQYIAPLMANFDTNTANGSVIRVWDNGNDTCTIIWEKLNLMQAGNATFTFAAVLRKNGDIEFAYKDIPIPIQVINNTEHPVKVGISDAYLADHVLFYLRRKTIYEYHRIDFKNHNITSGVVIKFTALPNCLNYETCENCTNHNTTFNCSWCPKLKSCSSGVDRNKQNWHLRNCDRFNVTAEAQCNAPFNTSVVTNGNSSITPAKEGTNIPVHEDTSRASMPKPTASHAVDNRNTDTGTSLSSVAGVMVAVALAASIAAWILYAYTHPHTASGQILIKYRPSRWNWRRGEARYTAATIHM